MKNPSLPDAFEALIASRHETVQAQTRQSLGALAAVRVRSIDDILSRWAELAEDQRLTATWVLGALAKKRAVPKLLEMMQTDPSPVVRGQAACELSSVGGKRAVKRLTQLAEDPEQPEEIRCNACYALAFVHHDDMDVEVFRRLLANPENPPDVRAQAAEGLAYHLSDLDRRRRLWRGCIDTLMAHVTDLDVEVRFYCVFALGSQRARKALPHLRSLAASDHAISRSMGWSVQEEARDAIFCIEHGSWPDHNAYTRTYASAPK